MNKYKIPCTEEQTKKALELGAPLERRSDIYGQNRYFRFKLQPEKDGGTEYYYVECPTAEEMIGWLEEQLGEYSSVYIVQDSQGWWSANVYDSGNYRIFYDNNYHSRKESTLAAIDAALEYLSNNK